MAPDSNHNPNASLISSVRANLRSQSRSAQWARDPVLWAKDVLGVHLWSKQQEITRSVRDNKRTVVASCHGSGKSMIASIISCWWIASHPPGQAIVVSTAPTYPQVNKILWEEMRKHHHTSKQRGFPLPGRITQGDEWKLDSGQIMGFGRKPQDGDRHAFQGIHRRYVLVVIDEACGVPEEIWTGAEAITTNDGCRILAIGNPDDRDTEFGRNFLDHRTAQDWSRISIPAVTTPNFTGEAVPRLLNEVLVSKDWCAERLRAWGEDDPRYTSKVLAQFPDVSESSLFPPDLIAASFDELSELQQPRRSTVQLGVDVARFGTDRSTVVSFAGKLARVEDSWTGADTVSSAHRVLQLAEDIRDRLEAPHVEIRVDAVGLGAGVVDTLAARHALLPEPWFTVREMHGSASVPKEMGGSTGGYGNSRAWWHDQLKQNMRNGSVRLALHDTLREELGGVRYKFTNGRLYIESKEDIRKRSGKSPDFVDALVYATAPVYTGLNTGDTVSEDPRMLLNDTRLEELEILRDMQISPF